MLFGDFGPGFLGSGDSDRAFFASLFANGETGDIWRFDLDNTDATAVAQPINNATGLINKRVLGYQSEHPSLVVDNGQQALYFDGVNDRLAHSFGSTVAQPGTIIVSMNSTDTATHAIFTGSSTTSRWQLSNDSSDNIIIASSATVLDSTFNSPIGRAVITAEYNGASSRVRKNGTTTVTGNAGTGGTNQLTIGALWDGTAEMTGYIYSILFINRILTSTELTRAEVIMGGHGGLTW